MIRVMSYSLLLVTPLALLASNGGEVETEPMASLAPTTTTTTTTTTAPLVAEVTSRPTRGVPVQVETTTTIPAPRVWEGPIPAHYGAGSGCSPEEATVIAQSLWDRGADDDTVEWMLGMVSRESICDPAAHNGNRSTGDDSWGLCQINALAGWFSSQGLLSDVDPHRFASDFAYNVDACVRLWVECGRGPWNYGNYYCRAPEELR